MFFFLGGGGFCIITNELKTDILLYSLNYYLSIYLWIGYRD